MRVAFGEPRNELRESNGLADLRIIFKWVLIKLCE
jgi:hypothetical protein